MFLYYWFLSGFISFIILSFYSFFIGVDSKEESLQETLEIIIDWRFWITTLIASIFGFITFIICICALILFIYADITTIKVRKKEFLEKTPWYQQKIFGGWKEYNTKD